MDDEEQTTSNAALEKVTERLEEVTERLEEVNRRLEESDRFEKISPGVDAMPAVGDYQGLGGDDDIPPGPSREGGSAKES